MRNTANFDFESCAIISKTFNFVLRLFERCIYDFEILDIREKHVKDNQFWHEKLQFSILSFVLKLTECIGLKIFNKFYNFIIREEIYIFEIMSIIIRVL